MSIVLPVFTPIQETLFLTLCGRALDNRSPDPILADTMADELVGKLGYDCDRFRLSASPIINIAHRAKKLDEVAQQFIARHPHAVGLDLGAGLDTRVFRIAAPATVDWYDVDYPEVITTRQRLLPDRENAHGIGTDLTDPAWLDASHRPFPQRGGGLQRLLQVRHLGGQALPRHPIGRRPHPVPGLRRPPPTRTLEPEAAAGQGDPADPGTRGRPVPAGASPVHPPGRPQHRGVPTRHHRPAVTLLVVQQRSRS
jgi:Leucine carboxyl methyltransferase